MTDYNLKEALNDFKAFTDLKLDAQNLYLNMNFVPSSESICSFNIRTSLCYYILINNKLHSLYDNVVDFHLELERLDEKTNCGYPVEHGYIQEGIMLKISSQYKRFVVYQLNKMLNKFMSSLWYYTDLIYDIGCCPEDGDGYDDEVLHRGDGDRSLSQSLDEKKYYKQLDMISGVKLVQLSSIQIKCRDSVTIVSSGDGRGCAEAKTVIGAKEKELTTLVGEREEAVWCMGDDSEWELVDRKVGSVNYSFEWILPNRKSYWGMSSKRCVQLLLYEYAEECRDRLV